jgi:hypothetical protein
MEPTLRWPELEPNLNGFAQGTFSARLLASIPQYRSNQGATVMTTRFPPATPLTYAGLVAIVLALSGSASAQVLGPPPERAPRASSEDPGPRNASADWRTALAGLKLTPRSDLVRKKHHFEVDATTDDGRRVVVSFDLMGHLWEVEDEDHDKDRYGKSRPVDSAAAVQAAGRAGFADASAVETKKNHTVVRARTREGETVDLHVDRGGYIYKQVWVRPGR